MTTGLPLPAFICSDCRRVWIRLTSPLPAARVGPIATGLGSGGTMASWAVGPQTWGFFFGPVRALRALARALPAARFDVSHPSSVGGLDLRLPLCLAEPAQLVF
jgi:hypothetical protein